MAFLGGSPSLIHYAVQEELSKPKTGRNLDQLASLRKIQPEILEAFEQTPLNLEV